MGADELARSVAEERRSLVQRLFRLEERGTYFLLLFLALDNEEPWNTTQRRRR